MQVALQKTYNKISNNPSKITQPKLTMPKRKKINSKIEHETDKRRVLPVQPQVEISFAQGIWSTGDRAIRQ
jgi:hypothetical protein